MARLGPAHAGKVLGWVGVALFAAYGVGAPIGVALHAQFGFAAWRSRRRWCRSWPWPGSRSSLRWRRVTWRGLRCCVLGTVKLPGWG
jgi:hypothetical protein